MRNVLTNNARIDSVKIEVSIDQLLELAQRTAEETANHFIQAWKNVKNPEFISQKEAMKVLGISSPNTIKKRVKEGHFSVYREGGRLFYMKEEILQSLEPL